MSADAEPAAESTQLVADQRRELPITTGAGGGWSWRAASARSAESQAHDDPGQDFLAIRQIGHTLVFAVCDGVSQSFVGDLAAREVGGALVDWLASTAPMGGRDEFAMALADMLQALTKPASELVAACCLPVDLPEFLRDALETRRAHGSESTFVCGRLDLPDADSPAGKVALAWMGDTRLRVWDAGVETTPGLGATLDTYQRWSTSRGPVGGDPGTYLGPLVASGRPVLARLLAYTDGLVSADAWTEVQPAFVLAEAIDDALHSATSDDLTLLELWPGPMPERALAGPSQSPAALRLIHHAGMLTGEWDPVEGASRYEIEVLGPVAGRGTPVGPAWQLATDAPGSYWARVRGFVGDLPSRWVVADIDVMAPAAASESAVPDAAPDATPGPVHEQSAATPGRRLGLPTLTAVAGAIGRSWDARIGRLIRGRLRR